MKRNPLDILEFTTALVVQFQHQPVALRRISEIHRKFLAALYHPDRILGGDQKTVEINKAFNELWGEGQEEGRKEFIEEFLAPKAEQFDRKFLNEDIRRLEAQKDELEYRLKQLGEQKVREVGDLQQELELFRQKIISIYSAILRSPDRQDVVNVLVRPPQNLVVVTRAKPNSYYARFFLVSGSGIYKIIDSQTTGKKKGVITVQEVVDELSGEAETIFGTNQPKGHILGCADPQGWRSLQERYHRAQGISGSLVGPVSININHDFLPYLLEKIDGCLKVGQLLISGMSAKGRKNGPIDFIFNSEGIIESLHLI